MLGLTGNQPFTFFFKFRSFNPAPLFLLFLKKFETSVCFDMPPKKGTKKVNEKKDGTNLASNSTGYAGLPIEFESDMGTKPHIDRRAEQNRDLKKRQ